MAYQYPTYQQTLPDTTLYERLQGSYTPIQDRLNPYANFEQGMLSQDALDYQADPFAYVKKKFGGLDKVLKKETPAVGLGGLFGSQPSTGGDSASDTGGRNYYQEIEDRFYQENLTMGLTPETAKTLAAQQAFEIQSANNARINAGLTLFGNAVMPGATVLGLAKYGPNGYRDYLQGNARVLAGDTSGYQGPYAPKPAGVAAPVGGGTTYTPTSLQETLNATGGILTPQQAQAVVNYTSGGDSGGGSVGYGGQDGRGGQSDSALTGYTE